MVLLLDIAAKVDGDLEESSCWFSSFLLLFPPPGRSKAVGPELSLE